MIKGDSIGLLGRLALLAVAWSVATSLPAARSSAEPRDLQSVAVDETDRLPQSLVRAGWRLLEVPGKAPARFSGDRRGLEVRSDGGVAFLYRPLADGETDKQRLSWRWRVESAAAAQRPLGQGWR